MLTYTQQLWQQGMKKGVERGMQEGVQQGLQQGERSMLLKLLKRRFGERTVRSYEDKILEASSADIERWAENILAAKTIEEVFS